MTTQQGAARADGQINGVNVDKLQGTIDAIKAAPVLAQFTFRATNRWMKGGHNRTTIQGFWGVGAYNDRDSFVIDSATPDLMLGGNEAPNPFEYVLHAFVGCLTTTFVYHASLHGVRVDAVESRVEGDLDLHGFLGLDESARKGFHKVRATFRVKADCLEERLRELMQIAQRRSPVFEMVTSVAPLSVTCEAM
jgi:uncharacterized OsmC-like protein